MSHKSGYIAIVGRPNVGKSTLLNQLIGQKLCITSRKPQTTRNTILGIKTTEQAQFIYVDTPGMHQRNSGKAVNRYMNRAAQSVLHDVDVILFLVDRTAWLEEDEWIAKRLQELRLPVFLLINKIDLLDNKEEMLPHIAELQQRFEFAAVVPVAALKGDNLNALEEEITQYLPEGGAFFPEDQFTDRSERFLAGEIVREKIIRQLGKELPYEVAVEVEEFKRDQGLLTIGAVIYVDRAGQKSIVIGKGGQRLKQIGTDARVDMQKLFDEKIMLRLWVKVKQGWANDERALKSLGLDD
jgi:GTP-binding protein Era